MINPAIAGMIAMAMSGQEYVPHGNRGVRQKPGPSKEKRNARKAEKKARKRNRK